MRSALFWDITRRRVVIVYRRFGTTYRSHTFSQNVVKQLPYDARNFPEERRSLCSLYHLAPLPIQSLFFYVGRSNLNENLLPFRAQINLYERACADKL
jgi:hypothetical protein